MQPRLASFDFHSTRGKPLCWALSQPGLWEDPIPLLSPSLSFPMQLVLSQMLAGDMPPTGTTSLTDHSKVPGPGNGFGPSCLAPAAAHPSSQSSMLDFWVARVGAEAICSSPRAASASRSPSPHCWSPSCPRRRGALLSLGCRNRLSIPEIQAFMWEPIVTQPPSRNHHYRPLAFSWFL